MVLWKRYRSMACIVILPCIMLRGGLYLMRKENHEKSKGFKK